MLNRLYALISFGSQIKFAKVDFLEQNEFFGVRNFYGHLAIQNSECIVDHDPSAISTKK